MAWLWRTPYYALSMGITQQFFVFLFLVTVTFELGRDFCTMYLTAKFDRPTFSRSEVIMRMNKHTDKQTDAAENIHLASQILTLSAIHNKTPDIWLPSRTQSTATAPWPIFISRLTEGTRLSWPEWLVTYKDGIPANVHLTQYKPGSIQSNFVDVTSTNGHHPDH